MGKRISGLVVVAVFGIPSQAAWGAHAPAGDNVLQASTVLIVTGRDAAEAELNAARMLQNRILKQSAVSVETVREDEDHRTKFEHADVIFVVGTPQGNRLLSEMMRDFGARLPTLPNSETIHPEGFTLHTETVGGMKRIVVTAGADGRGTIYGVGHVLRAMTYLPDALLVPAMNVQDKPAFPIRGGRPRGPGSRARQFGELRPQTSEEAHEMEEDLMLLGTNLFEGDPKYLHTYDMLTYISRTANEMAPGFPKEWAADGGRATKYMCPSVPEARAALLASFDEQFRNAPDTDFFFTNSGDVGGCRCDKCMPWGDKYIRLVHDIADLLHKYHPDCKVLATNQDLTNEGNEAIFDYLRQGDASWLWAIWYGPGADEMQTYIRGPVNPRWFEYEGFGPVGNYLKWMHHELPHTTNIVLYTDITHWMQAQYAVPQPDIVLAAVYDRRSWNARPRSFGKIGKEILHYALGDMHYSEGMHDDFNKWFWYRLLWDPNLDAEAITREYCGYWFGPDARDEAAQAIFLMEETLEKPVLDNPGIQQAVDLLRSAGAKIPENLLKTDWRWRVISQKALVDRYIQLALERGRELKDEAAQVLAGVEASAPPAAEIEKALAVLGQPLETEAMVAIINEARQRGEESNATIGYREPAPAIVGRLDLTEIGWWKMALEESLASADSERMVNAAKMILHYEDPGPGGYYDDLGWPNESPRLTHGQALWGFRPFPGPARHSHYNLAYSWASNEPGVTLAYDQLDPKAQYVVRFTVGGRRGDDDDMPSGLQLSEGLKADEEIVSDGFAVSLDEVRMYEFDVPPSATADGKVELSFTAKPAPMTITAASEVWLMKKDSMPWTANR